MKTESSNKKSIGISNGGKIFWPEEGYTKLNLGEHYEAVFKRLQPYVQDRILTMERCPDGMNGQCFYQKEKPKGMPMGTASKRIRKSDGGSTNYVVGGSLDTQLALVNLGCIPIHVCGSRAQSFPKPDWVCIDIDPGSGKFSDAAEASLLVKQLLDALKLVSYVKTSGSRGVHIFIPIKLGPNAGEVLSFAESLVRKLATSHPKLLTIEHSIAKRGKRVYLDAFRNGAVQTVVAPYSVRRRLRAPVSTPLAWTEVTRDLDPGDFNIGNFNQRLKMPDPWANFFRDRQSIIKMCRQLGQPRR
jgi:bifunctional non-homologous end joining protein LigD